MRPWQRQLCHPQPTWTDAAPAVRAILEKGTREWVHFNVTGNSRSLLYWVTPKAAHTTILRLLRRPPFQPAPSRTLQEALTARPIEFTFVREPLELLISAAAQVNHCIMTTQPGIELFGVPRAIRSADNVTTALGMFIRNRLFEEPQLFLDFLASRPSLVPPSHPLKRLENFSVGRLKLWRNGIMECVRSHLRPQTSGYAFDTALGVNRLHFVGRVRAMEADWATLLQLLNLTTLAMVKVPSGNRRKLAASLQPQGAEWRKLELDAAVRRHIHWDLKCFSARLASLP